MSKILATLFVLFSYAHAQASSHFELWQQDYQPQPQLQARDIFVYLPPNYHQTNDIYPTIYMHDGQNLFDPTRAYLGQTWQAEKTLNYLIENKIIEPVIVIAIDNTSERIWDYTPTNTPQSGGGGANNYLEMIVENLIPHIESHFRVHREAKERAIIGSSLGGLVSLFSILSHPDTFSKVAALSPSLWWDNKQIIDQLAKSKFLPERIWIDSGSLENEITADIIELEEKLSWRLSKDQLKTIIQSNAGHSEKFWAQRLPYILKFLFPKK